MAKPESSRLDQSSLRFGIIGAGQAASAHAEVLRALGHTISGVASRRGSPRTGPFAERFGVEGVFEDWRAMLNEVPCDALIVAVSWDQMQSVSEGLVDCRLPCLLEKPLALTSKAVRHLAERLDPASVMVGYNRRFYEFLPTIKERLEKEPPRSIEINCPEPIDRLVQLQGEKIIDHMLLYMTSHWLDLVMYLVGDLHVRYIHRTRDGTGRHCLAYNGILEAPSYDVPVHLSVNLGAPSQTAITISFSKSVWRMCPVERLTVFEGLRCVEPSPESPFRRYEPEVVHTSNVDARFKPGFRGQMAEFVDAVVLKSGKVRKGCTLDEAYRVTALCERIAGVVE